MGGANSVSQSPQSTSPGTQKLMTKHNVEIEKDTQEATVNKEVTFTISVQKAKGDTVIVEESEPEVGVELEALADNTQKEAAVTCTSRTDPYKYMVSYTPHVRGRHVVIVTTDKTRVATQEVFVHCPPEIMIKLKPVQLTFTVNKPSKIIVDDEDTLYVLHISNTSRSTDISRFKKNGRQDKPITSKYMLGQASTCMFEFSNWNPKAIAVDSDKNIYIAHMHTLDKLSPKGELLKSINFEDAKMNPAEVVHCLPEGMRFHRGSLYVCNGYNNTVLIFDSDLNLQRSLKTGRESKYLQEPHDIELDNEGNIYIADVCAHKVLVYNSVGQYLRTIGSHGKEEGQLDKPIGLVVDSQHVYIAEEMNHRISVFKISGEFVCSFQGGGEQPTSMEYPSGIARDADGFIYLCDRRAGGRVLKL